MANETAEAPVAQKEDAKSQSLTAYLQAPRKKRKNFVIMAVGEGVSSDVTQAIEAFVKRSYPNLSLSKPSSPKDLRRQFGRNISLLILDDEFTDRELVLGMVLGLKTKRRQDAIPVLFFTRFPEKLVDAYHSKLSAFHENDEYCEYGTMSVPQIIGRVKVGIDKKNRRRSRRYKVDIPIRFFHLTKGAELKGKLVDLSVHGGAIESSETERFRVGDQLRISIPTSRFVDTHYGEYIRLSARVRRVFISGDIAGISFEYLNADQKRTLVEFVTNMASRQLVKKSAKR